MVMDCLILSADSIRVKKVVMAGLGGLKMGKWGT